MEKILSCKEKPKFLRSAPIAIKLAPSAIAGLPAPFIDANPLIKEQAEAFKVHIRLVLIRYLKQAVKSDRTTLANKLREAGHSELIKTILDL